MSVNDNSLTSTVSPLEEESVQSSGKEKKRGSHRKIQSFFPIIFLGIGLVVAVVVVKQQQDVRNKAFTGYTATTSSGTTNTNDVLTLAKPQDLPQDNDLASEQSVRGAFYFLTHQFKEATPQYQFVSLPDLSIQGKVFFIYKADENQSYVFSRFENMPSLLGRTQHMWLASSIDPIYFHLTTIEFRQEAGMNIAYGVFVGRGDLSKEGTSLVYSYDTQKNAKQPENTFLVVKF